MWLRVGSPELPIVVSLYNTIPPTPREAHPTVRDPDSDLTFKNRSQVAMNKFICCFFFTPRINYLNYFIAREEG